MALIQSRPFLSPLIKFRFAKHPPIPKILISTTKTPKSSSLPILPLSNPSHEPVQIIRCVTAEESSSSSSSSSTSSVFVKGLPLATTEGSLRKAFSDFGQVIQVKIIVDQKTKQSLGYGYVWFTREEDAWLAVEEMNGKFFDGRFILVKMGKPGFSDRRRRKAMPYKF